MAVFCFPDTNGRKGLPHPEKPADIPIAGKVPLNEGFAKNPVHQWNVSNGEGRMPSSFPYAVLAGKGRQIMAFIGSTPDLPVLFPLEFFSVQKT